MSFYMTDMNSRGNIVQFTPVISFRDRLSVGDTRQVVIILTYTTGTSGARPFHIWHASIKIMHNVHRYWFINEILLACYNMQLSHRWCPTPRRVICGTPQHWQPVWYSLPGSTFGWSNNGPTSGQQYWHWANVLPKLWVTSYCLQINSCDHVTNMSNANHDLASDILYE